MGFPLTLASHPRHSHVPTLIPHSALLELCAHVLSCSLSCRPSLFAIPVSSRSLEYRDRGIARSGHTVFLLFLSPGRVNFVRFPSLKIGWESDISWLISYDSTAKADLFPSQCHIQSRISSSFLGVCTFSGELQPSTHRMPRHVHHLMKMSCYVRAGAGW